MADIRDWSVTAASNTDLFPEGMAPSAVNDGLRTVQAEVAQLITDIRGTIATTGSSNAYNISLATTPSSLADGLFFSFTANHTNTGAATLAVTPGGASAFTTKAIRKNGAAGDIALGAGDIVSGNRYDVKYEASAHSAAGAYILANPTFSPVISATDITPGAATHEVTFPTGGFEYYNITLLGVYPTTNSKILFMEVKVGGVWITTGIYYENIIYTPTTVTSGVGHTVSAVTRAGTNAWQISQYTYNNAANGAFVNIRFNPGAYGYPAIHAESGAWMGGFIPSPVGAIDNYQTKGFVTTSTAEAVRFYFSSGGVSDTLGGGRVIVEGKRVA